MRRAAEWSPQQYMEAAEQVEEKDGHYRSVLQTRKMGVLALPWHVTPASDDPRDVEIAEFVTETFGRRGFQAMLFDALDGLAKGYSVTEIEWSLDANPGRMIPGKYHHRDPRYFSFDFETMTRVQLRTDEAPTYGVPLTPSKFVSHIPKLKSGKIPRAGLAYTVMGLWICKSFVLKDWMAFSEVFGMPLRYGKYNEAATDEEKDALLDALQNLGSDASMIISKAAELEILGNNTTTHGDFYEKAERFFNQEISKVVLGQTMTTEDGSSLAQAKVHGEVRSDIRNADAKALAETINGDLLTPLVQLNFGLEVSLPVFAFDISEPEDLQALAESLVPFIDRGLPVSHAQIYERFGLTPPAEGDEVLGSGTASSAVDVEVDESPEGEPEDLPDGEEAMSARQAADRLGMSVTQVYSLVSAGELTLYRQGNRSRFVASEVQARAEAWASSPFAGTTIE